MTNLTVREQYFLNWLAAQTRIDPNFSARIESDVLHVVASPEQGESIWYESSILLRLLGVRDLVLTSHFDTPDGQKSLTFSTFAIPKMRNV